MIYTFSRQNLIYSASSLMWESLIAFESKQKILVKIWFLSQNLFFYEIWFSSQNFVFEWKIRLLNQNKVFFYKKCSIQVQLRFWDTKLIFSLIQFLKI